MLNRINLLRNGSDVTVQPLWLPYYEAADAAAILGLVGSRPTYLSYSLSPPGGESAKPYFDNPNFQNAVGLLCREIIFDPDDGILQWLSFPHEVIEEPELVKKSSTGVVLGGILQRIAGGEVAEATLPELEEGALDQLPPPEAVEEVDVASSYVKSFKGSSDRKGEDPMPSFMLSGARAVTLLVALELLRDKQFVDPISTSTGGQAGQAVSFNRVKGVYPSDSVRYEAFEREIGAPLVNSLKMAGIENSHQGYSEEAMTLAGYVEAGKRMLPDDGKSMIDLRAIKFLAKEGARYEPPKEPQSLIGGAWRRLRDHNLERVEF